MGIGGAIGDDCLPPPDRGEILHRAYVLYRRELCRFLRVRFGAGPPDPHDLAQQAFAQLAAVENPHLIENPRAFLYRTAINAAIDHRRSERSRAQLTTSVAVAWKAEAVEELGPQRIAVAREDLAILRRALSRLTERDRTLLLLNRLEGMSFAELARRSGLSPSGVRLIVEQSLQKCEAALEATHREQFLKRTRRHG